MQYVLLSDSFGNLNTFLAADKVGPGGAVIATGVDFSNGSLSNKWGDVKPTLTSGVWDNGSTTYVPANSQTIVPWGVGALGMTGRYEVARWSGMLFRSHKGAGPFPAYLNAIQYTSNSDYNPTWDYLGLMVPATPAMALTALTTGTLRIPAGSYTYYVTFYNNKGHESPPQIASISFTATRNVRVTIPTAYVTAKTNNNSTLLEQISDTGKIRPGMRLKGSNIPSGSSTPTYVVSVDYGAATATLSETMTGTATSVLVVDAQVSGVRIYRSGGTVETPRLVTQIANLATATFDDNKLDSELGAELETENNIEMPLYIRDVAISPEGVLTAVGLNGIIYFNLRSPGLYDPSKVIGIQDSPLAAIYALNRFIYPTARGAFTVTISDAFSGLPVVESIDADESCSLSYFVYMADTGGQVVWNTSKGICATDGTSIQVLTKYTFSRPLAQSMIDCYGCIYWNGELFYYAESSANTAALYSYTGENGWRVVSSSLSQSSPGAVGFHINDSCVLYTGNTSDSPSAVRKLEKDSSRTTGGVYRTGDWSGEKLSALKKFRKVSIVCTGQVSVQPYVDGVAVGSALTTANNTAPTRTSWWLPSGTKGRSISLQVTLTGSSAEVDELGVWVGEQREPMP